jgi:hypothetical protein
LETGGVASSVMTETTTPDIDLLSAAAVKAETAIPRPCRSQVVGSLLQTSIVIGPRPLC